MSNGSLASTLRERSKIGNCSPQKERPTDSREKIEDTGKENCLPPIHHIKMDLNVNVFRETGSKFKKTNWPFMKKKK